MALLKNNIRGYESTDGLDRQLIAIIAHESSLLPARCNYIKVDSKLDLIYETIKNKLIQIAESAAKVLELKKIKQTLTATTTTKLFSSYPIALFLTVTESKYWLEPLESVGFEYIGDDNFIYFDDEIQRLSTMSFQKLWNFAAASGEVDYFLQENGELDAKTFISLENSPCEGFRLNPKLGLPARILKFTHPMQHGDDILEIQTILMNLGIELSKEAGNFGEETAQGIKKIQKLLNQENTGIVNNEFMSLLKSSCAITDNHKFTLSY